MIISNEENAGDVRCGQAHSETVRIQSRRSGDMEIVSSCRGEDIIILTIPKEKRAELAAFLVA